MATMHVKPWLVPTGEALLAAIKAAGTTPSALAREAAVSGGTIHHRLTGRSSVKKADAQDMARILKCDWRTLVSPLDPSKIRRANAKARRAANGAGPATRALALYEVSSPPPAVLSPPRPTPVLGLELLSDGTALVHVKAVLPPDRGAELFRLLLDFGLTSTPAAD